MTKAIINLIKKHNNDRAELAAYNKGIKFLSMKLKDGENFIKCCDGNVLTKYEVRCKFKPANKWDNNVVIYQFNMYSNGDHGFYFDGTAFER